MIPDHRRALEEKQRHKRRVIGSYQSAIVRLYCTIRFMIINMRILEEIEQYLPQRGRTLDLGCGFGLFSLHFALCGPERTMRSIDLNARRIAMAQRSAEALGVAERVDFRNMNVMDHPFDEKVDAIVTLDLLHHLPVGVVPEILGKCAEILRPGGTLIVKDVDSRPVLKRWFTWWLDKFMDPKTPVNYYHHSEMIAMLAEAGFEVKMHRMIDILPYPHVLYIARRVDPDAA